MDGSASTETTTTSSSSSHYVVVEATAASAAPVESQTSEHQQENTPSSSVGTGAAAASSSDSARLDVDNLQFDAKERPISESSSPPPQQQQQQPVLLRGTTAPSSTRVRPSNDDIIKSWIQQSLQPPASDGTATTATSSSTAASTFGDHFVDVGLPPSSASALSSAGRHRKQRSLGTNWLTTTNGFIGGTGGGGNGGASLSSIAATAGFLDTGPPAPPPSFFRNSDHNRAVSVATANTTSSSVSTNNINNIIGNVNSEGHTHTSSHSQSDPLTNPDLDASWSNHTENELVAGPSDTSASLFGDPSVTAFSVDDDLDGIPSDIHDAARITNWMTVVELCQSQPEAAAYIGRDGWTALHHACNRRCPYPDVVEALIRAYPDALLVEENEKGWLPIHLACRFKAPKDVVRLLLHMYPEKGSFSVSRPDRRGRCPLYYAVRYDAPPGVVSLLLESGPSAVLEEDQNSESPLALIWNTWAIRSESQQTLQRIVGVVDENVPMSERAQQVRKRLESRPKILDRWNKVNAFLKAAFGFELDDDWELVADSTSEEKKDSPSSRDEQATFRDRTWRILHAVSSIKCHHSLFKLACALHPEQAGELDHNDLRRIDDKKFVMPLSKVTPPELRGPTNVSALHLACSSSANGDVGKHVITQLMMMYPSASQLTDSDGCTALHRIAANVDKASWTQDGAEVIYAAYPDAVRTADLNGQLPLHHAAKAITYSWGGIDDTEIQIRSKLCRLLRENDEASHQGDHTGCLPFHYVARYGMGWDLQVQALYDSNTAAVQARAGVKCSNRLPIHMAAANTKANFSLISKLVELNPRATGQTDRKGKLPLHLACETGHPWDIIECILNAHHDAIQEREENQRGWKALHMAAYSHRADGDVVSNLTRLHPQAAGISDQKGRYPLHLACFSDKAWCDGLSDLFDAYPEAIRTPDLVGLLPLHIMSFRYCSKSSELSDEPPKVIGAQARNTNRSAGTETNEPSKEEMRAAKHISNLFDLIRADPTVLDGICLS